MPSFLVEERLAKENPGYVIVGLDEVGVACYAGPLVAAAVCLLGDKKPWLDEVDDSKVLSPQVRERLSGLIIETYPYGVGVATSQEVDAVGPFKARIIAMRRALTRCNRVLPVKPIAVIVDDTRLKVAEFTPVGVYINKGDQMSVTVAAASVVAKAARDAYMVGLSKVYPGYRFETNVGYGTPDHEKAIVQLGPIPEHRQRWRPVRKLTAEFMGESDVQQG